MNNDVQVVWITGASSGIGRELARQYAARGMAVAISARRLERLETLASEIARHGGRALPIACDVTDTESITRCVDEIVRHFGRIDITIANAGCAVIGALEHLTAKDWHRQFAINVTGLAMTARSALPHLQATRGRLVLIGSVAAYVPNPNLGAYGASKAAVHNIGQTLQLELKGTGISCTVIHPGFVDSDIARVDNEGVLHPDRKDPRPSHLMWSTEQAARAMMKAIAQRRRSYVFTGHGKMIAFIGQHFPRIARGLIGKLPSPPTQG